jgi:branched-chain amino acid transport system ATP-binding protein
VSAALVVPALEARAVSKRYGAVTVFEAVTASVAPGEVLGIVGPNGAGKTTFLSTLTGAVHANGGTVLLRGAPLDGRSPAERCRRGLARTYQVPRPFVGLSVYENALVAARFGGRRSGAAARWAAFDAVERVGLAELADYEAGTLGLLHRKRLELAKALATGPDVLLLDEIAGGLTDPEVQEVIEIIRRLRGDGLAIIWIEHIVHALLAVVDRLLCLAGGRVLREGNPREVLADPAVRAVYLGGTAEALLEKDET